VCLGHQLAAHRRFVLWYDSQGFHGGTRRGQGFKVADSATLKPGQAGIPDKYTLHRWRTRLGPVAMYPATVSGTECALASASR
jgi:hypothetical protein